MDSILNAESGDIASALSSLGMSLGEEESAQIAEQLGKPRCIGKLNSSKIEELELHSDGGKEKEGINKSATMLIVLDKDKLRMSFESLFALPELQTERTLYYAIPSQQKMEENVVINKKEISQKTKFSWEEKDKDDLAIKGDIVMEKLT